VEAVLAKGIFQRVEMPIKVVKEHMWEIGIETRQQISKSNTSLDIAYYIAQILELFFRFISNSSISYFFFALPFVQTRR